MPDFPDILLYAGPFFALSVFLEWLYTRSKKMHATYEARDAMASMSMGVGNLASDILMSFISFGVLMFFWQFRIFDWGFNLWVFAVCLIAQDFVYYYKHYAAHRIRWFWSAHIVHHSSEHYNLSTALRQPWNNHITGFVLLSTPLVFLGFHPLLIGFVGALNLIYQFWIHTETIKKMPVWFEFIFNTPSHHRVHHATNPRYLDSNFAGIFIIWDRMFGTFVAERDDDPVKYGVVTPIETFNPIKIAFAEMLNIFKDVFKRDLKLKQRLAYIFAPPGYSHDGSRKDSAQIKADYLANHPNEIGMPGL